PTANDDIICIVSAGVIVGSQSIDLPAFNVGIWPSGCKLTLQIRGRIQGRGGQGDDGSHQIPRQGGDALFTRYPVTIKDNNQIWSGGGGGRREITGPNSYNAGGGGQGYLAGLGNADGTPATSEDAGRPRAGFRGGLAGEEASAQHLPCGHAIDGYSFISFQGSSGDIRGPHIN
ncbi:hypothetical protein ACLPHZ_20360, partial [Alcaligenaceae bacterium Me47]